MQVVVIYESMFGCTRSIAEAIAKGLSPDTDCLVVRSDRTTPEELRRADLVVVGAPTHAHGLPRPTSRLGAPDYVRKSDGRLQLEHGADVARGVREFLAGLSDLRTPVAAFDTRSNGPAVLTGRASKSIARSLRRHGASLITPPQSFLTSKNELLPGERERAVTWGRRLQTLLEKAGVNEKAGVKQSKPGYR